MNINPIVSSPLEDLSSFGSDNLPGEFLPRYPVEPEPNTFIIAQEENPDIIEGPPRPFNDQVGAINEGLLDEYQNNEVRKITFKSFNKFQPSIM